MSFWNSRHVGKTKKDYKCIFCGCKIPVGSSCYHETGTFDGDFNDYRLCERCHYLFIEHREVFLDDSYIGDFLESLEYTDILDCPKCGKLNMREYEFSADMLSIKIECDNCDHEYTVDLSIEGIRKALGGNTHE